MPKLQNHKTQECGVCGEWTADGRNVESKNRDRYTGLTEFSNFICRYCEWEHRNVSLVGKAVEGRLTEQ